MWGPRSRGDGEAAALDRLVPTDSVNRASLNSNIMPGVSDRLAVMQGGGGGGAPAYTFTRTFIHTHTHTPPHPHTQNTPTKNTHAACDANAVR